MLKRGRERGRGSWLSNGLWLAILIAVVGGAVWFITRPAGPATLSYGEFKQFLEDPKSGVTFQKVKVSHTAITGEMISHQKTPEGQDMEVTSTFRTARLGMENDPQLPELLQKRVGKEYEADDEKSSFDAFGGVFMSALIAIPLFIGALLLFRYLSGGTSPLTFGRSRHKVYAEKDLHITFDDVAGIEEAVAELREVVDFLSKPEKYQALGGRIPKGVLLVGPPGTGKTLLAKAVAGEAQVPFFSISGSDFVEMFVGVGAARVRDLFAQAESRAPCIIFIDELDALGKTRSGNAVGSHDEREQTLNQLLVEMDGFDSNRGVILMAATNRPETLDAALLRPGRFDRTVVVDRPDITGREAILKVHVRNVKLGDNVDLRHVASLTPGSVGADLANLVNEAALMAARAGKTEVSMAEFDEAIERGQVGLKRQSRIMHDDEKQRVAYHEAGHALVACALPNTHPVHKISIIPRGVGALGYVLRRPEDDRYLMTQSELESHIKVALGGTLAEELVYREISNGATSDLREANRMARSMVKEFGMSRLGRVYFRERQASAFLPGAQDNEAGGSYSEETAREIDLEVAKIIEDAADEVRGILQVRHAALEALADRLIEKEVIDGAELRELLEQFDPGPKLVPGTLAKDGRSTPEDVEVTRVERHAGSNEAVS